MMSNLNALALAVSDSLALSILVKVTITTALALAAIRLARKTRAAVRHVTLTAAFALMAIVPIASVVVPALRLEVPLRAIVPSAPTSAIAAPAQDTAVFPARDTVTTTTRPVATAPISWPTVALYAWIAGVVVTLLPVVAGLWQVRRVRRTGLPWMQGHASVASLAAELRLRRVVDVQLHESISGPMTSGIFRPAIVLPTDAPAWSPADLSRALAHELEHVRRADWLTQCLARVICAIYWFHPLVWIAREKLALEAERVCDDAVLLSTSLKAGRRSAQVAEVGANSTAYADQLVDLAARLSHDGRPRLLAMASRTDLATRIRAVLDDRQPRGRAGVIAVVSACIVAAALAMTVSPLQIVAAQTAATQQRFDVAAIRECGPEASAPSAGGRGGGSGRVTSTPGHMFASCMTTELLVRQAFNDAPRFARGELMGDFNAFAGQVSIDHPLVRGGPDWVRSTRYEIEATATADVDRNTVVGPMLQTLIAERFQLTYHWETELIPVYAITLAKTGLKIAPAPCAPFDPANMNASTSAFIRPDGSIDLSKMPCGVTQRRADYFLAGGVTIANIAWGISAQLDRPLVDKTGLTDKFNVLINFEPAPAAAGASSPADSSSMLRAIEDQLGVKIESSKAQLKFIKIDQIQKPKADGPGRPRRPQPHQQQR